MTSTAARSLPWRRGRPGPDASSATGAPAVRRVAVVTPLGWAIVALGIGCWAAGVALGWKEPELIAGACLALLLLAAVFTIGRAELSIDVHLDPPRVMVGEPAMGGITIRNRARRRLLPLPVELPVGVALGRFDLPSLAPGGEHQETFVIPTQRRAVIPVGPATSVRGDPLGILRREVRFGREIELFVHPRTTLLEPLGSGFLRDLEGNTTEAISPSDLAFHSLRPYVAGDDRRHVHWRTTARQANGELMVRQFLDTRRSHLVAVLDSRPESYGDDEAYELAISAGASLALRAVRDEQNATVFAGTATGRGGSGTRVLDAFSRATLDPAAPTLTELSGIAVRRCNDASIGVLLSGAHTARNDLRLAASRFDSDTRVLAIVADPGATPGIRTATGLTVLTLSHLGDLVPLVKAAIAA